jgi:hypothetical protein
MAEQWFITIADNAHFMDDEADTFIPPVASEAIAIGRAVGEIEYDLADWIADGKSGEELWSQWSAWGVTPFISGPRPTSFSAVAYVRWRCGLPAQK